MLFFVHLIHVLCFAVDLADISHLSTFLLAESVQIAHQLSNSLQASSCPCVLLNNSLRLLGQLVSFSLIIDLKASIIGIDAHL